MEYFETSLMPNVKFLEDNIGFAQARYQFALKYAFGKIVLDAGCGTGYGTYELSKKAKKVYGIDQNIAVIKYAQKVYKNKNLSFQAGNLEKIRFPKNRFDLICIFEVIEHVNDYKGFLKELYRVLKPGGTLLISTPNKSIYSPYTKRPFYPYHFHEFYLDEFKEMLVDFKIEAMLGQSGKNIFYPKWHPKSILKIIYTYLPRPLKKKILNYYIKLKQNKNKKIYLRKLESNNLNKARIFVAVCKKI